MPLDQITRLRQRIGESIPSGGADTDTMFSDVVVADFLTQGNNELNQAAYIGWLAKVAIYADLATTTEGNAARNMSDLYEHAKSMVKYYEGVLPSAIVGRTRIGKISRPGTGSV